MSDEQIKILIGLDVEIVICYDQDISLHHIRSECERFYKIRPVSYVFDKWGILNSKESPADKELKIFNFMLKHRIKYGEKEHLEYLKGLELKNE
jgi:DNA primase